MRSYFSKEAVEKIFEEAKSQEDYLVGIYRLVFPNWDDIETIHRWPSCNSETWGMICRMAMAWDELNCPEVLAGGAWMNNGFSSDNNIKQNWRVSTRKCRLV